MSIEKQQSSWFLFPIKGFIARALLSFFYWLPHSFRQWLAVTIAKSIVRFSAKQKHIIETNLAIAFPDMEQSKRSELLLKSAQHAGLLLAEFPIAWLGSENQIKTQFKSVTGNAALTSMVEANQPVIIVMPHLGNWELLVQWIQLNYPMFGLYKPSKLPQVDQLIYNARSQFGCQPFPATTRGVMGLMRQLKKGGVMGILPDQVPQEKGGTFTNFFGKPAYTMTLLHKLTQKTNAQLLFAACIRGQHNQGFSIELQKPIFETQQADLEMFNQGLNQQLELMIRQYPEQYVWDYKRYKRQPDGTDVYAMKQ